MTHRLRLLYAKQGGEAFENPLRPFSREAAELLRLITMYPGILELQLIRFFPGKETKIKNLLSHLKKQGRILLRENGSYSAPDVGSDLRHDDMEKAVWVLLFNYNPPFILL